VKVNVDAPASAEANYRVSFARIREELGFVPNHTLIDGIAEIRAMIEAGSIKDYADTRYSNQKSLALGAAQPLRDGATLPAGTRTG
jgi:hypothetical protein